MKTRAITMYKNFKCMEGTCPDTCCYGWKIPVDDESAMKYREMSGGLGAQLRLALTGKDLQYFRKPFGKCPFHTKEGLCKLQQNQGKECMPYICREYPRKIIDYHEFCEITLELSCPMVAELFLKEKGRMDFADIIYDVQPMWSINNDAPEFLHYLEEGRGKILDYLWQDQMDYADKISCIYEYVRKSHECIVRDRLSEAAELSIDPMIQIQDQQTHSKKRYGFYPIAVIDKMIANIIDHKKLKWVNPTLYQMIQNYYRCFNEMTGEEADDFFAKEYEKMVMKDSDWEKKYLAYFSYYIQQCYLMAYEDYHILRIVMLGILYTQLLMIFDLVNYQIEGEETFYENEGKNLASFEKRIRHNENIAKKLMNMVRDNFL